MSDLNAVLAGVGGLVLLLGLFSGYIHGRLPLSDPLLALLAGIAIGPAGASLLDPAGWGPLDRLLEHAARLTLGIGLMATALRLPPRYFLEHWRLQAVLLGVVMPLMWGITALLAYVCLGVPVLIALLVGAVLTPTDPIVASSIVTAAVAKKRLSDRIRHALSGESGANDGLAYAFVSLPLLLLTQPSSALTTWLGTALLYETAGGIVLGLLIGGAAGWLLTWGERRNFLEESSFLAFTLALALLVLGIAGLTGCNGVVAVFAAGVAFDNMVGGKERAEEARVQEAVNQFFTLPVFALIGLVVPVNDWIGLGWRGATLALAILALRRLPGVVAVRRWLSPVHRLPDAVFIGWFGPIGVSALLYAAEAMRRTAEPEIWPAISLVICASIAAHGVTALPFTRWHSPDARG